LLCALLWWWFPAAFQPPIRAALIFLAVNILLNSRVGLAVGGLLVRGILALWDRLRAGLLVNLFRFIVRVFKQVTDMVEYVLSSVDEWLRFRSGETRLSMAARAVLGVVWFPVSYVVRFYILVLVEPGINPIKFPICSVAAKLIYPFSPILIEFLADGLSPIVGTFVASAFAWTTVWLLPDAFGFLFWEMKENWSLYRANRSPFWARVVLGRHGERLLQFLRPGFHWGTVPKLSARLRQAERTAYKTGIWRAARSYRQALAEVEAALRHFV